MQRNLLQECVISLVNVVIEYLKAWTVSFFTQQQKVPCLLSGVNVNGERENHPPQVETRVKDRKRYVTLLARGSQSYVVRSFQRKAC